MSRATDAFSSLISDVPGVDTSCFVKRSLNELKGKEVRREEVKVVEEVKEVRREEVKVVETEVAGVTFASMDLDALGKTATPKAAGTGTAAFENLFDDIPGCEETVVASTENVEHNTERQQPPETEWQMRETVVTSTEHDADRQHMPDAEWQLYEETEDGVVESSESEERTETMQWVEEESAAEPPSAPAMEMQHEQWTDEPVAKTKDLKQRFEKYRTKFNKKAVDFKKKGVRAMKQGLDAAQEWMDKYVEDRKQSSATSSQRKEDVRQIEQFLAEMEKLSHFRREQLMSEIPAEFFQKVVDYAAAKRISIEHLFVTGTGEAVFEETESLTETTQQSSPPDPESEGLKEAEGDVGEAEYVEVTGDESQRGFVEVTGDDSQEISEVEEDFDLLGLSASAPEEPLTDGRNGGGAVDLASPDDLDAFFTGGQTTADNTQPSMQSIVFHEEEDLMAFEGGCTSNVKSDLSAVYERLRQGGQHTEEEIRSVLREKRQKEKETKMAAALQAKMEREREVEQTQELLHNLKEQHLEKIVVWKEQHANNMRGLLTTLQTVLWEGSGWKPLTVADVLEPSQVKKAYMKANLIIHPDKVKQKGGTADQVVLADMVFNVLKEGWQSFQC